MLKSPSMETLCDSSELKRRRSSGMRVPSSIIWRSLRSRSDARAARSTSEKKGPWRTVFTQWTAHSFDSWTSWYSIPPLLLLPSSISLSLSVLQSLSSLLYSSLPCKEMKGGERSRGGREGKGRYVGFGKEKGLNSQCKPKSPNFMCIYILN